MQIFQTLYDPGKVTLFTTSFNIQQFYILSQNVFMCFVWISEQTAIISLYNIN